MRLPPMTVADLLAELDRIGADPATTTIQVSGSEVYPDGVDVHRDRGAAVVDIDWDWD